MMRIGGITPDKFASTRAAGHMWPPHRYSAAALALRNDPLDTVLALMTLGDDRAIGGGRPTPAGACVHWRGSP